MDRQTPALLPILAPGFRSTRNAKASLYPDILRRAPEQREPGVHKL